MATYLSLNLEWINKSIIICSDSQVFFKALDKFLTNSKLLLKCKMLLNVLGYNKVKLLWVPGHCEVEGNKGADILNRNGSSSEIIGPEPALRVSK